MNQAKFDIHLTSNPDGTWHAEAVAAWPEAKIFTADARLMAEAIVFVIHDIDKWINTWPEHLRPGYQPPVFDPGALVEHKGLPGIVLEIAEGPEPSAVYPEKAVYWVKFPSGEKSITRGENLRLIGVEDICQT